MKAEQLLYTIMHFWATKQMPYSQINETGLFGYKNLHSLKLIKTQFITLPITKTGYE